MTIRLRDSRSMPCVVEVGRRQSQTETTIRGQERAYPHIHLYRFEVQGSPDEQVHHAAENVELRFWIPQNSDSGFRITTYYSE